MLFCCMVGTLALHESAAAADADTETSLPYIEVTANYISKTSLSSDPVSNPAAITVFDYPVEKSLSVRDYAALLKPVPGVSSNNFDQGGVGFGLTLRGFSERSNGSNVAVYIDGIPINQPSNTLSNGYADLTPLIPELVDRFMLTRGPFDVRAGANSLGGSLQISTLDTAPSSVALTGGNYNYGQGVGVYGFNAGGVQGYGSLVGSTTTGYRENSDLHQINSFNKALFALPGATASVRMQIFMDDFGAPGYINRVGVQNGTLDPRGAFNPSDGGTTTMENVAFNYKQAGEEPMTAIAYVVHTNLNRYSSRFVPANFVPTGPGQALQQDKRLSVGGSVDKFFLRELPHGAAIDLLVGAGVRSDDVISAGYNTILRIPKPAKTGGPIQTENTDFTLTTPFGYAQVDFKPLSWVKLTGGVRYDWLHFDIQDHIRSLFVKTDLGVVQPKAGLSISPFKGVDIFANYGRGYVPPSAIGGQQVAIDPDAPASILTTKEVGVQYNSPNHRWHFLIDGYKTTFTDELQGQPAPLPPISLGPSLRNGEDVEGNVNVYEDAGREVSMFANYSKVDAKLVGRTTPGDRIPDIASFLAKYGFQLAYPLPQDAAQVLTLWIAQVFEGPRALEPTGTLMTKTYSRIDATLAYRNANWHAFSAFGGFVVYPDRRLDETAFLFNTIVGTSPKAPLTVQGGFRVQF